MIITLIIIAVAAIYGGKKYINYVDKNAWYSKEF
jgi:hypothetical protein